VALWKKHLVSSKSILAKKDPYFMQKLWAADASKIILRKQSGKQSVDSKGTTSSRFLKPFHFEDNLDVSDFLSLPLKQKTQLKLIPQELERIFRHHLPYMLDGTKLTRENPTLSKIVGFWRKLPLKGSQQSVSRDNASLFYLSNG
jgi:hypothetical protein